jgi:hypothetical protein
MNIVTLRMRGVGKAAQRYLMTSESNPEVMAVLYAKNIISDPDYLTYEEAALITSLPNGVFKDSNIKSFNEFEYFGVTVTSDGCFRNCSSLVSIKLPNILTTVYNSTFINSGITSLNIPNSVKYINQSSIQGCTSLATVTIGSGIESIGNYAFYGCSSLTSLTILATDPIPTLGTLAIPNKATIYVPSGSVNDYKTASGWSSLASRIQAIPT